MLGVSGNDTDEDIKYVVERTVNIRIFPNQDGHFDLSAINVQAELLVISQFTLYGDVSKGRRPTWSAAAGPELAEPLLERVVNALRSRGLEVATGQFRADMVVDIRNVGPATLMLEV